MKNHAHCRSFIALALLLMFVAAALAQMVSGRKTALVVNGHKAEAAVVQIDGHSWVEVESLARILNAKVSFESGLVRLTTTAVVAGRQPEPAAPEFSKDFAKAGISQLAEMREWKGAIASAIRFGIAAGNWLGPWLHEYRVRAEEGLSQATLAAKTEADQKALQLLKNELASLREWDANTQATIQSLNAEQSVNPAAAQNDPRLLKISECGNFLSAMLVGGEFVDSPSCH